MAQLEDVNIGALNDGDEKINSIVKQVNEHARRISNEDRVKIIKDASGTPRILFGEGPGMFYGMKVSQEGFDVTGAADDELVFNSDQNVFKIIKTGELTIPVTTVAGSVGNYTTVNTTVASVAHGLSFKPAFIAFFEQTTGVRVAMPYTSQDAFTTSTAFWGTYTPAVSNTNFFINLRAVTYGTPVNTLSGVVRYYLLQETAE